jgi:DNA (cytosine-5)-methyltransferase 1
MTVPVIDLFAGPGGLGEGFSRTRSVRFDIAVSIEKDAMAHETLRLRAAHRALSRSGAPRAHWNQWDRIIADEPWNIVFDRLRESGVPAIVDACDKARHEAWNIELGPHNRDEVSRGIRSRLKTLVPGRGLPRNAVLIGGPPCQAYSIVGRSRNRGTEGYRAEDDHRHFLYREYLHVISEFEPAVFVMENVKGILTSRVADRQMFTTIMEDLKRPGLASNENRKLEYALFALPRQSSGLFDPDPQDFLVQAELHGVPQARHRVIVCGIRSDVLQRAGGLGHLGQADPPSVGDVIGDLPCLRPQLSFRGKGMEWRESLDLPLFEEALAALLDSGDPDCRRAAQAMKRVRTQLAKQTDPGAGADRAPLDPQATPPVLPGFAKWYRDRPLRVLANHEARAHMPSDLVRYLFMACFGQTGSSPKLGQFPACLLPEHRNVDPSNLDEAIFKDRFRVQLADRFSMTVTSHIAKDGHAFIHPDPLQCRSLTVREAARLQTFPDSYVFLGNRTSQFTQVGNAVPPYLAVQIAELVGDVLSRAGLA